MRSAVEVIRTKRDGRELSDADIAWMLQAYVAGDVAHEQMSALLMAILWRGLSPRELSAWTGAMVASGERMDLSGTGRPVVDKHSSGGVGDKVSLVVAPLVAALGVAVPKLSGRGLGHTGGTLDKLEAIPGWRGELTREQFLTQLREVGAVIGSAGENLAPADKQLYALRDVTGTVESIPLIASSIMSKKIAGGADAVLLDVKVGAGAFMRSIEDARLLAQTMVGLGRDAGVRTVCLLTSMQAPLGRGIGNALEVAEAVEVLKGGGPADLLEVCLAVAREMLILGGCLDDPAPALTDGRAYAVWREMIVAQGGDPDASLPTATCSEPVLAPRAGFLTTLDALAVGTAAWRLGAGRARKEDDVDPAAGVVLGAGLGEHVEAGQVLAMLHADTPERLAQGRAALLGAYEIADSPAATTPLVLEKVG
ncbi:MAG: thymidine phosphorylase [Frankiales bacterium]|nr:thymidine phosphorylase [Frankiales bacterium]